MNNKFFIPLLSITLLFGGFQQATAQKPATTAKAKSKPFQLTVKMKNYPDSLNHVLLLGRYYGGNQYITDTIKYNPKTNHYTVSADSPKEGGLYLLITADRRYAELIIDKDQQYIVEAEYPDLLTSIKFIGSPENQLYQDFAKDGTTDMKKLQKLNAEYKRIVEETLPYDSVEAEKIKKEVTEIYKEMDGKKDQFMKDHPEHLMSILFRAQKEIDVPAAPEEIPDSLKQEWQYEYYKNHYFDNFDLCDDRVIRTPLFHQRLVDFCDKVLKMQLPDTVKFTLERLVEKTRCAPELFKYVVWYTVDKYQRSEIIGHDAIWVHLAKRYYLTGDAFWASQGIVENFKKRIERIEPLLIGNVPPEFSCPDTTIETPNERWVSVFSSKRNYTVVIFWSITCGHCKRALPKWHELYKEKGQELGIDVIAICKDSDIPAWKKYIKDYNLEDWTNLNGKTATLDYNDKWDIQSTPVIYILDRNHRIVTKRIDPDVAEPIIRYWEKTHYKR
ncbi:MAG: DUF5106 domain-containing protein [Bacteroidales bacterium]|jgi:thiol-disulfide isomerase/thioredoxin|nr:DUF5106 domain-containing protein [Bacteroidales bacterium]